jgi:hypothetical protein
MLGQWRRKVRKILDEGGEERRGVTGVVGLCVHEILTLSGITAPGDGGEISHPVSREGEINAWNTCGKAGERWKVLSFFGPSHPASATWTVATPSRCIGKVPSGALDQNIKVVKDDTTTKP